MWLLNRLLVIDLKTVWELPVSFKSSFLLLSLSLCLPVSTRTCLFVCVWTVWACVCVVCVCCCLYLNITQTPKCCTSQVRWERTVHKDSNYRTLSHCPSTDPLYSLRYPWDIISVITALSKMSAYACVSVCVCEKSLMEVLRCSAHPKRLEIITEWLQTQHSEALKGIFLKLQATSYCPSLGVYMCFCMCTLFSYFLIWAYKRFKEVFHFSC